MPHDYHIYIVGDNLDGIFKCLTLGHARVLRIRETYYPGTETVNRGFKRKPRSGRWLEEEARNHFSREEILLSVLFEFLCHIQDMKNLIFCEILD